MLESPDLYNLPTSRRVNVDCNTSEYNEAWAERKTCACLLPSQVSPAEGYESSFTGVTPVCTHMPCWLPASEMVWQVWLLQSSGWWRVSLNVQAQATNILPAVQVWPPTMPQTCLIRDSWFGCILKSCSFMSEFPIWGHFRLIKATSMHV